ncbi:AAA family ATPase [uncultured Bacteroides sp.]|uniref:ATP-dependent DNA helicase n=1 Tax=uncultured Bacteroides sp. TaxID=162156 RepID=UPI002AAB4DA6|nr:AAA family ATPase [uncultured Bacteroides sp.]
MINSYLIEQIKENFPHQPTNEQSVAMDALVDFLLSPVNDTVFILRGYAGTGKTSLVAAVVKTMMKLGQKAILLAPTGRAAKVFSVYSGHPAFTIHKKIYRQQSFSNELSNFSVNDNLHQHTLFIVDEASMISNEGLSGSAFGTGRLLDDLVQYVYSGQGCRLLLMGDTAQLPPVGEEESPALTADVLKGYGLSVREMDLTQVVRQLNDSGILWNATALRHLIADGDADMLPKIRVKGFPDIRLLAGDELIEEISNCYGKVGMDETIVACRSNKRANIYNKGIRNTILYREEELSSGDLLMVAKNNYFWTEKSPEIEFIANGDMAVVRRVRRTREIYGFRFADVQLTFPDYQDFELEATVLLDTLHTDAPALPRADNDRLFYTVLEDYADISTKRERMKKMKADPHYNALQIKYGYAVTCHKAQGGQWKKVFLDQGYISPEMLTPDYFRWLYTAFTRATETLYLVNYPKDQVE